MDARLKKKNLFKIQKEQEEAKRKRDDEAAAQVYEDFVRDFGDSSAAESARASGPPRVPGATSAGRPRPTPIFGAFGEDASPPREEPQPLGSRHPGKPKRIDLLLENLKRDQEEREQLREQGLSLPDVLTGSDAHGSHDTGDPMSTNLFVGNLAPDIDEQVIMREFGRFGPIASVKVMWPRDDEQRRRGKNTGFVAFMARASAERALDALDGVTLHELKLVVGWGKPVPLPPQPIWPNEDAGETDFFETTSKIATAAPRGREQLETVPGRARAFVRPLPPRDDVPIGCGADVHVAVPKDARQRFVIDAVACQVLRDGRPVEEAIARRERDNPEFAFMFSPESQDGLYYRWRVFSLALGDALRSWRVEPFLFVRGGRRWVPPPMTSSAAAAARIRTAAQAGRAPEASVSRDEGVPLPDAQRSRMMGILQRLKPTRRDIEEGMILAIENAEAASEVSELIVDSLSGNGVTIPGKVARLFLVSDILHNSTAPVRHASRYRAALQARLPGAFEELGASLGSAVSRLAQGLLRRHVLATLRAWRSWYIFPDEYLDGLQAVFLSAGIIPDVDSLDAGLKVRLEALSDDDLRDQCSIFGLSRDGTREEMVSRIFLRDASLSASVARDVQARPGTTTGPFSRSE